ncbi:hypothetical protein [Streptomyces sp. CC0208]|uniref:hypothetical protein n=1 Tax=Streptomyces sp. CC0208 TaxID=2306165 RepID=UPI000E4DC8FB|nr:hypothetical protein [Streptomyces sp. CC0208]
MGDEIGATARAARVRGTRTARVLGNHPRRRQGPADPAALTGYEEASAAVARALLVTAGLLDVTIVDRRW